MKKITQAALKDKMVWILFFGSILTACLFVLPYGVFGSKVDWVNQHSVFPDYFRQRFYETGQLFPDIAWNLGGGQNIYNFAYYGLFHPVYLISYLLPFIPMDSYIMGSSLVSLAASAVLFYKWIGKKGFPQGISVGTSVLFVLAAPMIYHSYNHVMFVNYMPFLLVAFMGTDRYLASVSEESRAGKPAAGKKGMLIWGVTGMIFASFYFSIGGLLALMVYAVGEFAQNHGHRRIYESVRAHSRVKGRQRYFIKAAAGFSASILTAVLLSGILLAPAFCALFTGRSGGEGTLLSSLLPAFASGVFSFHPLRFLYSPYGVGLPFLGLAALAGRVTGGKKWADRIPSLLLLMLFCTPIFGYLLNGGLYDKDKVFIPFLPLICHEAAKYMHTQMKNTGEKTLLQKGMEILPYAFALFLIWKGKTEPYMARWWKWMFLDGCLMLLLVAAGGRHPGFRKQPWQLYVSCFILFICGWTINVSRNYMIPWKTYMESCQKENREFLKNIFNQDSSLYRTEIVGNRSENHDNINRIEDIRQNITSIYSSGYNKEYQEFRKNIFNINEPLRNNMMQAVTDNPCFLQLMGVKYVCAARALTGYEKTGSSIFCSRNAAPILYGTDEIMDEQEYRSLSFPENQTKLLQKAVVSNAEKKKNVRNEKEKERKMKPCSFVFPKMKSTDLKIKKEKEGYLIEAEKETKMQISVPDIGERDNLFALSMEVENLCPGKDMYIQVEEQTNKMTAVTSAYANGNRNFAFMVSLTGKKKGVSMLWGKGRYRIKELHAFCGNLEKIRNPKLYQSVFRADHPIHGDEITGVIRNKTDGYLVTSIPYDSGFSVYIDGKKVRNQKVNQAFLGAKLSRGEHRVRIVYRAPGKKAGIILSGIGIWMFAFCLRTKKKS